MFINQINQLKTAPADLSKLSNVVKNNVVKKTAYDKLVKDVNAIHTTDTSDLVRKAGYDTNIDEIQKKIPVHYKYITATEYSKLTKESFAGRLKQANLSSKNDIADFVKKTDFDVKLRQINNKVTSNKLRHAGTAKKLNDSSAKLINYIDCILLCHVYVLE